MEIISPESRKINSFLCANKMNVMFLIGKKSLTLDEIKHLQESGEKIGLHKNAIAEIEKSRKYLDKKIATSVESVYGVTTGFGSLYDKKISPKDLGTLQENLVMSHACGTGDEVPAEIAKLILLLKIVSLSLGKSGVQLVTVQRLVDFYNNDILPVIYEQGSLGASGDLAPLAHLSLPLIGKGEVHYKGKKISTEKLYSELKWKPITLKSKEGLALLNGTQFMAAFGVACAINAEKLWNWANTISALSLDAFDGRLEPFDKLAQDIRPHKGQIDTAAEIRKILKGSQLIGQPKKTYTRPVFFSLYSSGAWSFKRCY
jgi:histidine ammonia-lyase